MRWPTRKTISRIFAQPFTFSANSHRPATQHRRLRCEPLEERQMLAILTPAEDVANVPFWDAERGTIHTPTDEMLNYFGGPTFDGISATLQRDTGVVHSGNGSYRIDTNGTIGVGGFDFVGTSLTGFASGYVDTRDITRFQNVVFWVRNETGSPFDLTLEIKDYRDDNGHRVRWKIQPRIEATAVWREILIPLDTSNPGWQVIGTPDLTRTKLFAFAIEASQGASVNGSIYLDDATFVEPGGSIDPQTAPIATILDQLTERMFEGLWGTRDRSTGFLPYDSAYADVVGINTTATLVKVLPTAISQGWVTQAAADAYVSTLVTSLNTMLDSSTYLPFRYADRNTLLGAEESTVDAAFMYLALYQYKTLPGTNPTLSTNIDSLLARFDFSAFSSPAGWRQAYIGGSLVGTYDGYSGEIWLISLAAHLNGEVDITVNYHSGVLRTMYTGTTGSFAVHTDPQWRAPFLQWIFPLFVDIENRGVDTYPVPALATNPYTNAVAYETEVVAELTSSC